MKKQNMNSKKSGNETCKTHENHEHLHGENCGHEAVKHGDHTDYIHDGHVHRVHGKHVDECQGRETRGPRPGSDGNLKENSPRWVIERLTIYNKRRIPHEEKTKSYPTKQARSDFRDIKIS